jgi:hypothetical protein
MNIQPTIQREADFLLLLFAYAYNTMYMRGHYTQREEHFNSLFLSPSVGPLEGVTECFICPTNFSSLSSFLL